MNNEKLFELYEKLYFHEVESRESITNRLQMPLALLLSIVSIYAFMLQSLVLTAKNCWAVVFLFLALCSIALFIKSLWHFIKAYYGSEYELLPSAKETENYRQVLLKQYADYDGTDGYESCEVLTSRYFDEYLFQRYIRASSSNGAVNDLRSYHIHTCNSHIVLNIIPLLMMFIVFSYSGINKNDYEKEYSVKIVNPVTLETPKVVIESSNLLPINKEKEMSDTPKPPPPAPAAPPDPRYSRDGVKPPTPRK